MQARLVGLSWCFLLAASGSARAAGAAESHDPQAAQAAPSQGKDPQTKELYEEGRREFNLGHYAEAIVLFEDAYKAKPVTRLLYNIAQCHRLLGQLEAAKRVYKAFIAESPAGEPMLQQAEEKLAEVEGALKTQANVKESAPTGLAQEKAPLAAPAEPVTPAPSKAISAPATASAPARTEVTAAPSVAVVSAEPNRPRGYVSRSLIGVGVVSAAVGTIFAFQAKSAVSDWHAATTPAAWNDATSRVTTDTALANTGFIVGAVLIAAGVSLLVGTDHW